MKTRTVALFTLYFFCICLSAFARAPEIKAQLSSQEKAVKLVEVDAEVKITGFIAQTTMTMKFVNPNTRVLEGELYFPLPESAILTGYGLDVNGDMVDGVAVEKQKGREVFEAEVRKGVDPGLVEKVKGNNFKTRVYPLNPEQPRLVKVVYTTEASCRDGKIIYRLPLELSKEIRKFLFRINVLKIDSKPDIDIEGLKKRTFEKVDSGWFAELSGSGRDFSSEIKVEIPFEKELVIVERADDGKNYFMIQGLSLNHRKKSKNDVKQARRVAVCYDASESGKKRDQKAELEFLTKFFASEMVASEIDVSFIAFRNKPAQAQKIRIQRGKIDKIQNLVEKIKFDGATSFNNITFEQQPDYIILLTDGIGTYGKSTVPEFSAPVIAVTSSQGSDYNFLKTVSENSGGSFINLKNLNLTEAMRECSSGFYGILNTTHDSKLSEVIPDHKQKVSQKYSIFGVVENDGAELKIDFGDSSGKVTETRTFSLRTDGALQGNLIRKLWAGNKISGLLAAKDQNRSEIVNFSKKYGIVTDFTSLIVLERVDQYIEHKIIPPASKPAWRKQYFEIIEKQNIALESEQRKNLSNILTMWKRRLEWWNIQTGGFADYSRGDTGNNYLDSRPGSYEDSAAPIMQAPSMAVSRAGTEGAGSFDSSPSHSLSLKREMSEEKESASRPVNPGVAIKAWKPDAEYAKVISEAENKFSEYLNQKKEFGNAPSFYLDCADIFNEAGETEVAIQVLSNIAELELENPALLRILAHRLAQLEELQISADIFEDVLEMRKEEPQSYRDLALVLGRLHQYQKAIDLLYQVVLKTWDSRFPEIEVIALEEMNNLIVKAKAAGLSDFNVDERLIRPIDVDLRIVMTWDADMTDMDIWVIEPTGEKAYYQNPGTAIGGLVSRDFTRGYGPEEYMIRKAETGTYKIMTNFYGSASQKIAGAVTLQVDVFTNFGRADEKRRSVTLRLKDKKETFTVAEVEF